MKFNLIVMLLLLFSLLSCMPKVVNEKLEIKKESVLVIEEENSFKIELITNLDSICYVIKEDDLENTFDVTYMTNHLHELSKNDVSDREVIQVKCVRVNLATDIDFVKVSLATGELGPVLNQNLKIETTHSLPSGVMPSTLRSVDILFSTSNEASCRMSTESTDYESMYIISFTGSKQHSYFALDLTAGASYRYFFRCKDYTQEISDVLEVNFSIAASGTTTDDEIEISTFEAYLTGLSPMGIYPEGTRHLSIEVETSAKGVCRYATSPSTFDNMIVFTQSSALKHKQTLSNLRDGLSYTYYIKCRDFYGVLSNDVMVNFSIEGQVAVDTNPPDPVIPEMIPPTEQLILNIVSHEETPTATGGTYNLVINLETNENANCLFSRTGADTIDPQNLINLTGSKNHSHLVWGLVPGQYSFHFKCSVGDKISNVVSFDYEITGP